MKNHPQLEKGLSQKERLLQLLKDKKWHKTTEIMRRVYGVGHSGICRIGARVFNLRKDGHDIATKRVSPTVWAYKLI